MSKVSIVIPIYNTETHLRECLDSVVNQTLQDIEIILVDDGSTDGSAGICKEYLKADSRIRLIMQENAGPAAARKAGAKVAVSPYIGFVDSDDTIETDMYETLLSNIRDCDLVTSAAYKENGGVWKDYLPIGVYRSQNEMRYIIDNMLIIGDSFERGISGSMVCKLFLTGLVRKVFDSVDLRIYCSEDVEFICRYILQCRSVHVTDICKYHYRNRYNSVVHSVHHDYLQNLNLLYLSLRNAFIGHSCETRLLEQLQMLITRYSVYNLSITRMGFSSKAKFLRYINPLFNELMDHRVALYGAGVIGVDYYLHMARTGIAPAIWVDKQYEKYQEEYPVCAVEKLEHVEYDVLLIAVKTPELADSIQKELIDRGIAEQKIIWKKPICIV